jgi:hypothetical protein
MIENPLVRAVPTIPWEGEVPEKQGLLIFDRTGTMLGGGCIMESPDDKGKFAIAQRWCINLVETDWSDRLKPDDKGDNTKLAIYVIEVELAIAIQSTMVQLGQVWNDTEAKWVGRLEGCMAILDRLGVSDVAKQIQKRADQGTGKHNGESDIIRPPG